MEDMIQMIPIEWLGHHPDNPRKDFGDLTELAESIRKNGILQNLTIVASEEENESDGKYHQFWVVIGNRRLEASKMAGLEKLPCVLSEMDHKTQVATMLEENMQRSDLTVFEQAQGFQMMMDLGFTQKQISEKTGFSEKTVRDRIKLTKLNKKNFGAAVNRGATIMDLIEVTKLESKKDQDEVLKAAGTENFRQKLMSKLKEQEYEKNLKRLEPVVKEMVPEVPESEKYSSKWEQQWNDGFDMTGTEEDLKKHIQKLVEKTDQQIRYRIDRYGGSNGKIVFYFGKAKLPMSAEQKSERQKNLIKGKHLRYVKSFWAQAYELRKDFVRNYSTANGAPPSNMLGKIMMRYALQGNEYQGKWKKTHEWDDALMRELLELPPKPVQKDPNATGVWLSEEFLTLWDQVAGNGNISMARIMVAFAVAGGIFWPDGPDHGLYAYDDGTYRENSSMANDVKELYEFLIELGYPMSDMEKQLLDGTHECYQMEAL